MSSAQTSDKFAQKSDQLLDLLKRELAFLKSATNARGRVRPAPSLLFENSTVCPNSSRRSWPRRPCSECELLRFVPSNHRAEPFPCRHIPLNLSGDTLDGLYGYASDLELQEDLVNWLCEKVAHLESEPSHAVAGTSGRQIVLERSA